MALRCVYTDLDGTLLGRDGSLFRDSEGGFSMLQARVLEACHRAGAELVIKSGRREGSVMEDAKLIGSTSYICEVGCLVVMDGGSVYLPTPNVLDYSYEDAKLNLIGSNLNLNVTLVGETPSWLGLPPSWSISMPLTAGFSTTCPNVMLIVGLAAVVVTGKVLTTPLNAPTLATTS